MRFVLKQIFTLLLISSALKAQVPSVTITVPSTLLCTGTPYTFNTLTGNSPTAFSWTVLPASSTMINSDRSSSSVNVTFLTPGVFTFSILVSNANGTATAARTVTVSQTATAAFNASLNTVGFPNQMVLTNYSRNSVNTEWIYSDAAPEFSLNTVKNYSVSGNYTVTLVAQGNNGCNDTLQYAFVIDQTSEITMPNVFTPNADSANDIFKPRAKGIVKMQVYIYGRYGSLIHQWDKPQGYWDGRTSSGEPCQEGVYFWVLEATGFDGKAYKLKGNVTLMR